VCRRRRRKDFCHPDICHVYEKVLISWLRSWQRVCVTAREERLLSHRDIEDVASKFGVNWGRLAAVIVILAKV